MALAGGGGVGSGGVLGVSGLATGLLGGGGGVLTSGGLAGLGGVRGGYLGGVHSVGGLGTTLRGVGARTGVDTYLGVHSALSGLGRLGGLGTTLLLTGLGSGVTGGDGSSLGGRVRYTVVSSTGSISDGNILLLGSGNGR